MAFLVFEGIDGSGKSTLIKGLQKELSDRQVDFITTREPGGTELGDEIRQMLLRCQGQAPAPRTELLLYAAGRAQHVDVVIEPALKKKQWVLCDRFDASSVAFQNGGRGLNREEIDWLNRFATKKIQPDLYVLLDLSVEESAKRRESREADRFEMEKQEFHQRVRDCYLRLAEEEPVRWLVMNASDKPEALLQKLISELKRRTWLKP
jgi:dTMP kinase